MNLLKDLKNAKTKGIRFLEKNIKTNTYNCYNSLNPQMTNQKISPPEVGSDALILDNVFSQSKEKKIKNRLEENLLDRLNEDNSINFFKDRSIMPEDTDTTAIVLTSLIKSGKIKYHNITKILEKISLNTSKEGLFQIYFNPKTHNRKNKHNIVGMSNVCYLFEFTKYSINLDAQYEAISQHLKTEDYLKGVRYYFSPESNLYFISRLLKFPRPKIKVSSSLKSAIINKGINSSNPQHLAMDILTNLKINNFQVESLEKLLDFQNKEGSWNAHGIYRYGSKEVYFGSKYISTSFAIKAINESITKLTKT